MSSLIAGLVPPPRLADKGSVPPATVLARHAARQIVDFALPPRCPGCGVVTLEQHSFCITCWQALEFLGEPCCACCGLPFEFDQGEGALCGACLAHPPAFDRVSAAVAYGDISRAIALKLKYSGRPGVAETLAHFMQRHIGPDSEGAILVPVPLHRWRIWKRGYNQAALVATALARRTGLRAELDLLRRIKATPPLKGKNRRERALAVRGAFKVTDAGKAVVAGRTVLLVDDVFTSGATATACAKTLKRAGASTVNILCWARVVGPAQV